MESNGDDKLDRIIELLRQHTLRFDQMDERMTAMEGRLESRIAEVEKSIRALERRITTLSSDVIKVRADQRDLEDRVDKIEQKPS